MYLSACCLNEDDPCTVGGEEKFSNSLKWINESVFNVYPEVLIPMYCLCVLEK